MPSLSSILIANRGEIAVRVLRTARSLGLRTIAVYSEADAGAPHVAAADEAVLIGPAPVGESYLDMSRILEAARATGADAVHPGYGFLSENAEFAEACEKAGIVFIGPSAEAIRVMGNKAEAKRRMIEAGVPCVPGYEGADQADEAFERAAAEIGFPVMVKASAGGGGRGMRLVNEGDDFLAAVGLARSEAENAFGSGELILEKAIVRPRHVEIQVFADNDGNTIHLGERDCSVQRRHQKVIEESPCPVMTPELREAMGTAAVEAARSIGYRGAGTVEFLLDTEGNFYFLEMNTRLQVEHPVTEMVTRTDLVAMQIAVAEGRPLELTQEDVELRGHAIEARLYAEDVKDQFLPSTGTIDLWRPAEGDGRRFDAGIESGQEVSPFYDPMLAKVVAWGPTRETARRRLIAALSDTALFGPSTNRDFLIHALEKPTFAEGGATTAFIAEEFDEAALTPTDPTTEELAVAGVIENHLAQAVAQSATLTASAPLRHWASSGLLTSLVRYATGEDTVELAVSPTGANAYRVTAGETEVSVELLEIDDCTAHLAIDGARHTVTYAKPARGVLHLSMEGDTRRLHDLNATIAGAEEAAGGGHVIAPMHGMLLEVVVSVGDTVKKGDRLAVLEAMKMQHEILAEVDGTVTEVAGVAGTQVAADTLLVVIETAEEEA